MTPRERLLSTLNSKDADRVPVTLFIQDQGHFINQVHPEVSPDDYETLQEKVVSLVRPFCQLSETP